MPDFKSRSQPRMAIRPDAFNSGNALSLHNQPSLAAFLKLVCSDTPLTFVIGAGASVDSGFPTWTELIAKLSSQIADKDTARLARKDVDGPMRQAESIFRMLSASNPDSDADALRTAIYGHMPMTKPGPIASIIAELWAKREPRITLLTTNFDDVLEEGLEQQLDASLTDVSFSLYAQGESENDIPEHDEEYRGVEQWRAKLASEPMEPAVLHLHGMVRRRRNALRPVVLSESHFLWHGPSVREVLREQLSQSAVVFIGVSLTDPNLVGPLWDVSRKYGGTRQHPCFVLHVPSAVRGAPDIASARTYVLRKYEYMEEALGAIPVFFKSYSQLYQAFIEARLALEHDDYFDETLATEESKSYGARLNRRLKTGWDNVGAPGGEFDQTTLVHRLAISDQLARMVEPGSELMDTLEHPGARLAQLLGRMKKEWNDYGEHTERFGLFVWLRSLPAADEDEAAPYALDLAAASTYVHRDDWSFHRRVPIEPGSPFPVARAVYSGLLTRQNLPETGRFAVWRGAWAIPLRISNRQTTDETDVVTVGAVALNTTHHVHPSSEFSGRVSVLAALGESQEATERVRQSLEGYVTALLRTMPENS